jgi:hypothetical protein
MLRDTAITFGDLIGKLDALRVACGARARLEYLGRPRDRPRGGGGEASLGDEHHLARRGEEKRKSLGMRSEAPSTPNYRVMSSEDATRLWLAAG